MRVGMVMHLGWAVVVVADRDHRVVGRRRVELVEHALTPAPIHHEGGAWEMHRTGPPLDDEALHALVAKVRASVERCSRAALDALAAEHSIESISLRDWPADFPREIAVQRRVPYESRADSIMYLEVLNEIAVERGWRVDRYDPKHVEADAVALLGARAHEVLHGPRTQLGPPWNKDHRTALAATVVAAAQ